MELNSCPYCNSAETDIVYGSFSCAVHCKSCNRYGPARKDETESIEEWNNLKQTMICCGD